MSEEKANYRQLRILFVEDNPADFRLCLIELGRAGIDVTADLVSTQAQLLEKLRTTAYDIIVSDYHLPGWTGMDAFKLSLEAGQGIPFILLTGILGDDKAVECLKKGVSDYILKDRLSRLPIALLRAVDEKLIREERVQAERHARFQAKILFQARDAVITTHVDHRVSYCNPAAEQLYELKGEEILGQPLEDLPLWTSLRPQRQAIDRALSSEGVWKAETTLVREAATIYLEISANTLTDENGKTNGMVVVARNISERKHAEAERLQLLADEQAARKDAEKQRRKAEEANRAKDEFLATLSHELRTPLNAIIGWAHLLVSGALDKATTERAIESINRNALAQVHLIEDLLDLSRIISGKLTLNTQSADIVPIIEAATNALRPAADAKKIEFVHQFKIPSIAVILDPARMQQVIWNLLSNAVKFTPEGGRVEISLEHHDARLKLSVQDTGKGIHPEFLPHVFERFRQADSSSTRAHGGLGLGLAIVRSLTELHGGTVGAESAGADRGAKFTVTLPVKAAHERKRLLATSSRQGDGAGSMNLALDEIQILVVEDEPDCRELVITVLRQAGAEVTAVASAKEALAVIEFGNLDVLVSDIQMPEQDGYSLIKQVRALEARQGRRIPAAALTAHASPKDRTRALLEGYDIHLSKPIDCDQLLATISNLAGRS